MARVFFVFTLFLLQALSALGRGGGGGGGAGGGGGGGYGRGTYYFPGWRSGVSYAIPIFGDGAWAFWLIITILVAAPGLYFFRKIQRKRKRAQARKLLKHLMCVDPVWDESRMKKHVESSFHEIQQAWCAQDLDKLDALLTSALFRRWRKRIRKAQKHGHHDVMSGTKVLNCSVVNVQDYLDDDRDNFTVELHVFSNDWTIDRKERILDKRDPLFTEFWTYRRRENDWLLDQVRQLSDAKQVLTPNFVET